MSTFNDYGIVLHSYDLGEKDKILNIYTKENGLVRAVAKGVKTTGSKFSGKAQEVSCSYFQFAKGKNLCTICDLEQVNGFPHLRSNLLCLSYALLFVEVVSNFAHEGESESEHIYELLYSSLDSLQETPNPELLSLRFVLKFLSYHGINPQFDSCVSCSSELKKENPQPLYPYSSTLGGLLCNDCRKIIDNEKVSSSVIYLLKKIAMGDEIAKDKETALEALDLLKKHLDVRAKREIKSFELVFSL